MNNAEPSLSIKILEVVLMYGCSNFKLQDYFQGEQYLGIKLYSELELSDLDSERLEYELSALTGKIVKITGLVIKTK